MSFFGGIKKLFAGAPGKSGAKSGRKATKSSKTDRARVIAEAMGVYRRERAQMTAGLDAKLKKLRDDIPKALKDPEELSRLLSLHRAHVEMRRMMASDHQRFLVLSGMRELLGDPKAPKAGRKTLK